MNWDITAITDSITVSVDCLMSDSLMFQGAGGKRKIKEGVRGRGSCLI